VVVAPSDVTTETLASLASAVVAGDGSFTATVPLGFGSNVIPVAATAAGGLSTGYGQLAISNEGGGTVLDVADPNGDDNALVLWGLCQSACPRPLSVSSMSHSLGDTLTA
jgi:glucoamylase